jgi:hypothetical protein
MPMLFQFPEEIVRKLPNEIHDFPDPVLANRPVKLKNKIDNSKILIFIGLNWFLNKIRLI